MKHFGTTDVETGTIENIIKNELQTYTQYLNGETYGYRKNIIHICDHCNKYSKTTIETEFGFYGKD
jgi:hypothetical protein